MTDSSCPGVQTCTPPHAKQKVLTFMIKLQKKNTLFDGLEIRKHGSGTGTPPDTIAVPRITESTAAAPAPPQIPLRFPESPKARQRHRDPPDTIAVPPDTIAVKGN